MYEVVLNVDLKGNKSILSEKKIEDSKNTTSNTNTSKKVGAAVNNNTEKAPEPKGNNTKGEVNATSNNTKN